jgi:hypothetical protein
MKNHLLIFFGLLASPFLFSQILIVDFDAPLPIATSSSTALGRLDMAPLISL